MHIPFNRTDVNYASCNHLIGCKLSVLEQNRRELVTSTCTYTVHVHVQSYCNDIRYIQVFINIIKIFK